MCLNLISVRNQVLWQCDSSNSVSTGNKLIKRIIVYLCWWRIGFLLSLLDEEWKADVGMEE